MKIRTPYLVLFLLFVVLGVYYPVLFAPLNSVDDEKLVNSLINSDNISLRELFLSHSSGYYYRPLLYCTYILDNTLWGLHESFMHLENILWHAVNSILVFLVAGKVMHRYGVTSNVLALSAALLFALHPVNTEAVNWISGRTDLMAAFFILLALFFLLSALEDRSPVMGIVAAIAYLLGCFCKETAVFFLPPAIFIVFCYDAKHSETLQGAMNRIKARYSLYLALIAASGAYLWFRQSALSKGDTGVAMLTAEKMSGGIGYNLHIVLKTIGFYAKKLFFPWPLNFAIVKVPDYYLIPGLLVVALCLYLLYRRDLIAALLLTSISIGSSALLVLLGRMAWTPIAERYMYIPCAIFAIAITLAAYRVAVRLHREKIAYAVAPLLLAVTAWASADRNIVWQDNLTLFTDTVNKSPDFPPARNELAVALMTHGKMAEGYQMIKTNKFTGPLKNKEFALNNVAGVMAAEGDLEGARLLLLKSLDEKNKNYLVLLSKLAEIEEMRIKRAPDPGKAREIRRELVELLGKMREYSGDPFYYYRIGQNYLAMGEKVAAQSAFAKAYQAAPADAYYRLPAKKLAERLTDR